VTAVPSQPTIVDRATVSFDSNGNGTNDTVNTIESAAITFDVASIPTLSSTALLMLAFAIAAVALTAPGLTDAVFDFRGSVAGRSVNHQHF